MACNYCDDETGDNENTHWARCKTAPDFVKYQARAELRATTTKAPGDRIYGDPCPHNHIDRGQPECPRKNYDRP